MRKIIVFIIMTAMMLSVASAEHYIRFGNVIDIEYDTDCVSVDDGLGAIWEFYGYDDFYYGDLVCMIMDDRGTYYYANDDTVLYAFPCTVEEAWQIVEEYQSIPHEEFFLKFL